MNSLRNRSRLCPSVLSGVDEVGKRSSIPSMPAASTHLISFTICLFLPPFRLCSHCFTIATSPPSQRSFNLVLLHVYHIIVLRSIQVPASRSPCRVITPLRGTSSDRGATRLVSVERIVKTPSDWFARVSFRACVGEAMKDTGFAIRDPSRW